MARMFDPKEGRSPLWVAGLGLAACVVGLLVSGAKGQEPDQKQEPEPPTFTKDVAPIFQKKCQNCHRQGHSGPFPLETYEHARRRASDIAFVAESRSMPPWKPDPEIGPGLKHDLSLTVREIEIILAWADADAPLGNPDDMPPTPQFAEGWPLGPPDLILEPVEDFRIPPSGPDTYRCFVLPTNLTRNIYVSAIDFRPSNTRVVHHITAFIDVSGMARKRDQAAPGPGYTSFSGPGIPFFDMLGFWAAGHEPIRLPEGIGLALPRQSDVILQIHYTPSGKPEVDRTRLGVYFCKGPVKQAMHWNAAQNNEFRLPPGESEIEIKASWYVPVDLEALAVSPHMHLLGRDIRMSVTYPSGQAIDLVSIPDWDPSWQSMYHFEEPIPLPAGSVVEVIAHFDNSPHPRNPHQPPRLVKWGHSANDEMLDGFIAVVKRGQDLTQPRARDDLGEIFAKQRLKNIRKDLQGRR
ncbi:hypothetical protein BH23PLA1_BH23PLA1_05150 [soil metagenome]